MKHCIKIFFVSIIALPTFSQNYADVLKITANTTSYCRFDSSVSKTRVNEFVADLTVPVKINEKFSVITGSVYESINTRLFADDKARDFGSVTLKFGFNKQLNDKWSTTLVLLPKIASDFAAFSNKDLQYGFISLWKFKKHDQMNYKFGLYYNSELFGPFFVPMLGLYYLSPNKKFESNLMLPLQADANYKILPFMNAGVNFNGQIRSYHLNNIITGYPSTYVARSTNEFYAYLKFSITNSISLQTKAGMSIGRTYKVFDENDKVDFGLPAMFFGPKRHQLNSNFSNGPILQVVLLYRFHFEKSQQKN